VLLRNHGRRWRGDLGTQFGGHFPDRPVRDHHAMLGGETVPDPTRGVPLLRRGIQIRDQPAARYLTDGFAVGLVDSVPFGVLMLQLNW
jgi:hypothetical protein